MGYREVVRETGLLRWPLGDSSGGKYQISGLSAATVYAIEVAAVNSAGTGDYSDPLTAETPESKCTYLHVLWNEMNIYLICSHYRCVHQSE